MRSPHLLHTFMLLIALGWALATGCSDDAVTGADTTARAPDSTLEDATRSDARAPDASEDTTLDDDISPPDMVSDVAQDTADTIHDAIDDAVDDMSTPDQDMVDPGGPPYPIVLAHGMGGFENLAGVQGLTYFFNVEDTLRMQGEEVLTTVVDPFNDSYRRGAQLLAQIEAYLATSDANKVIIIGHSQGGLDARWVAHQRPELVAAVITYATPHLGTPISDMALGLVPFSGVQGLVNGLVQFFGAPLYDELGNESDLFAPLDNFSQPEIAAFNRAITDQPGVFYASIAGRTDRDLARDLCDIIDAPDFIASWAFQTDPVDPLLSLFEGLITEPNDGLVRVQDARWGRFLGCVPADHMDQVGHLLGDAPGEVNPWDHLVFFSELVAWLRAEGF